MGLYRSLSGTVRAEIVSADLPGVLHEIQKAGIELLDIAQKDYLTLAFQVRRTDLLKLRQITNRRGDSIHTIGHVGVFWTILSLQKRPVLILGLALILLLSLALPSRVLFIRVEGNATIPKKLILEEAASCGISFGASTRQVRSEKIKNRLLTKIDSLQWAGVNTYGCVAVISVKERTPEPDQQIPPKVTSIVARRDGIILSVVAEQGSSLCKPGDAVMTGQKLISGYSDFGFVIQATQAKGEITALTEHKITAVTPIHYDARGDILSCRKNFALVLGKKRINFSKYSGILDASCARIYLEWYVTLPGGFVLPIGIICEETITYAPASTVTEETDLISFAKQYVLEQTVAGEILSFAESLETVDGIAILHGRYACRESLGITRLEENFDNYGKDS